MAAFFDAMGRPREEIADLVNVATATISKWRAKPAYKAEVERWQEQHLGNALDLVRRVKLEMLDAGLASSRTLRDLLEAADQDGEPLHGVRLKAAESLQATALEILKFTAAAETAAAAASNPAAVAAGATVTVIVKGDEIVIEEAQVVETDG